MSLILLIYPSNCMKAETETFPDKPVEDFPLNLLYLSFAKFRFCRLSRHENRTTNTINCICIKKISTIIHFDAMSKTHIAVLYHGKIQYHVLVCLLTWPDCRTLEFAKLNWNPGYLKKVDPLILVAYE